MQLDDAEIEVKPALMDSADRRRSRGEERRTATKFYGIKKGMEVVVGHHGIRVAPLQRSTARTDVFEFMSSNVSIEKPKSAVIREMAREFKRSREENGRILVVGGPAIVHTGAAEHFEKLIEWGFVQLLFAGNALAAHDIENALFGTSLGVNLEQGALDRSGHAKSHARDQRHPRRRRNQTGGGKRAAQERHHVSPA